MSELIVDPSTSSKQLSRRLKIPLSTLQRRRAQLERSILKKSYLIDLRKLGWRTGDMFISVAKGNTEEVAQKLLGDDSVIVTSIRVGSPEVNVVAQVFYRSSEDLHGLLEQIRAMDFVEKVEWSEVVTMFEKAKGNLVNMIFS